jgi:uncharacterized iron-regulated protein
MRAVLRIAVAAASLAAAGEARSGEISELDAFIEQARDRDVVVLGEVHDNPVHHANQARIVAALEPAALVFEMIPQDREAEVNDLRAEGASRDAIAEVLRWAESGWPDFAFYARVLEAAPDARVFGAGQPAAEVRLAAAAGAAEPFGPDAATYGLDAPLAPAEQAARERLQAAAHCDAVPPDMLAGMVEAQRFRDAGLADAALWARTMTGGGQVVVITGNGHADRSRGMAEPLRAAAPELSLITLGQLEAEPDPPPPFHHYLVTGAPERDDPCAPLLERAG